MLDALPARDARAAGRLHGAHAGHRPGVVAASLAEGFVPDPSAA